MFPFPFVPTIDMEHWPDGPWKQEPRAVSWVDGKTGLNCAMIRHHFMGSWCGYVAVDPLHPFHGKRYADIIRVPPDFLERQMVLGRDFGIIDAFLNAFEDDDHASVSMILPAHGSITYSDEDTEGFWWFGFDCCHAGDMMPGDPFMFKLVRLLFPDEHSVYRDHDYVYGIVTRLASALEEVKQVYSDHPQDDHPEDDKRSAT
jgi:hypothetical protein